MVLSLYVMVICLCAYVPLTDNGFTDAGVIAVLLGVTFFWIANVCYDRTITKLKNEIRELRKEIELIKE